MSHVNLMIRQDKEAPHNFLLYRDDGSGESRVIAVFFNTEEGIILATTCAARIGEAFPSGPINAETVEQMEQNLLPNRIIVPESVH